MRPTCTFCARKHLSQALVLLSEARQGYPEHVWLAIGHLAEAGDELIEDFPALATTIRSHRKALEASLAAHPDGSGYNIPFAALILACGDAQTLGKEVVADIAKKQETTPPPSEFKDVHVAEWPPLPQVLQQVLALPDGGVFSHSLPNGLACVYNAKGTRLLIGQSMPLPEGFRVPRTRPLAPSVIQKRPHLPGDGKSRGFKLQVMDQESEARFHRESRELRSLYARENGQPEPEVAAPSSKKCSPCEESAHLRKLTDKWRSQTVQRRIAIFSCLSDFRPSYSLVSVILDQVRAASMLLDTSVVLFVQSGADLSQLPPLPANVDVVSIIPRMQWAEDKIDDRSLSVLNLTLRKLLDALGGGTVITHDLVFQSWFSAFAKAWHGIGNVDGFRFYHTIHSSVGHRPTAPEAHWRCSIPERHTMLALNTADLPHLMEYYQAPRERFMVLHNPRDVRNSMPAAAAELVSKHRLHMAQVLQVYPLSAPRMLAKGLIETVTVLNHVLFQLEGRRDLVRLLVVDAHANGKEGRQQRALVRGHAQHIGFPEECLVFTSESLGETSPEVAAYGIDQPSVRALFQLANTFIFPTTSEAGSLVLMEAALAGNLLVLNESLPCMSDYVAAEDAIWAPFGSIKQQGGTVPYAALARQIIDHSNSQVVRARRRMTQSACLETYAATLASLDHPVPGSAPKLLTTTTTLPAQPPA